jgi:coproporphyrinogen III oxidase
MTANQTIIKETISTFFADLQDRICRALEEADGAGAPPVHRSGNGREPFARTRGSGRVGAVGVPAR